MRRRALMNGGGKSIDFSKYMTVVSNVADGMTVRFTSQLEYCLHSEGEWKTLPANTTSPKIVLGDKMSFRANLQPTSSAGIGKFSFSGSADVEGNCMSLLYGDNAEGQPMKAYGFTYLFRDNRSLRRVSKNFLPATTLANYCYRYMFSGCEGLTSVPDLPSKEIKAGCYYGMFDLCRSITSAPELHATTLEYYCYQYMFYGCTNLKTAPELPAEVLRPYCYYAMFRECTKLTKAPVLPARTLQIDCYSQMFYFCDRLNYVKALFTTTPSTQYTNAWLGEVASSGTFIKSKDAKWNVTGVSGVPEGWTIKTE